MTNLNEVANVDWKGVMVSPNGAGVGSGILTRLARIIHRIWDILDVDLDEWVTTEDEDGDYYPTGCCCY